MKNRKKEIVWNEPQKDEKTRPGCNLQDTNWLHHGNARIHHKQAR
jgi:hypothetical protein